MSDAFVIEAGGKTAGIIVRVARGFRFFAADHIFNALESRHFRRPADAQRAARALLSERSGERLGRAA